MEVEYNNQDIEASKNSQEEDQYVTLEALTPYLSESGYFFLAHRTGRFGNANSVVDSIFKEGLRAKDNSLYYTTIGLSTPTPEIKAQLKEMQQPEPTIAELKDLFNDWPHLNSKKIIIARIPIQYINMRGDLGDANGERYGAFMRSRTAETGKVTNYLDPKFILGCFDVEKQLVRLNPRFEWQLSPETIASLSAKFAETVAKTERRLKSFQDSVAALSNHKAASSYESFDSMDSDDEFDFSNIDWSSFGLEPIDDEDQDSKGKQK